MLHMVKTRTYNTYGFSHLRRNRENGDRRMI